MQQLLGRRRTRRHPLRVLGGGLTAALLGAAFVAPAAQATAPNHECYGWSFMDPAGFLWDYDDNNGEVDDGTNDAFDGYGEMLVDGSTYYPDDNHTCGPEDGGREFAFGPADMSGLTVTRKLYVSGSGTAFARWLDTVSNETSSPITVELGFEGNLGSDGDEIVLGTSDGDTDVEDTDAWAASDQDDGGGADDPEEDPSLGHLMDSARGPVADRHDGWDERPDGDGYVEVRYDNVTVEPGQTLTYMHVALQRATRDEARDDSVALGEAPPEAFAAMTLDELDRVQNWPASDMDADGVGNRSDNCATDANADQADLDGDGLGDVCDADQDGDGLSDASEADLGTNPRSADSDGDGVGDKTDACPTAAGSNNGCPVTTRTETQTQTQTIERSTAAPPRRRADGLTLRSKMTRVSRGLLVKSSGTLKPPSGISPQQGCGKGSVAVQVKSGKRTISNRVVKLRSDCTYRSRVLFTELERVGTRPLRVVARFGGNSRMFRERSRFVVAGRP